MFINSNFKIVMINSNIHLKIPIWLSSVCTVINFIPNQKMTTDFLFKILVFHQEPVISLLNRKEIIKYNETRIRN